ncbi:hypothetical protein AERO_05785 [Aeromicrobium fastidiosum]|uniref:hypothetical protein n=1 Tax=Aeromicrobium fastidiosum TaxID=52699 RepID=UPI0020232793|nr:hypothetical protein [Aeromicrobium fastidiosum]MCL8250891.1 hypothetical protein [Aeromicrobium fastidiosum]
MFNYEEVGMGPDVYARTIGWSALIGMVAGSGCAVLVAALVLVGGGLDASTAPFIAIAVVHGVGIGFAAGWVIGLPAALAAGLARRRTRHWRAVGTATAAGIALVVGVVPIGPSGVVVAVLAAGCAWWGLGRVFATPTASWAGGPAH